MGFLEFLIILELFQCEDEFSGFVDVDGGCDCGDGNGPGEGGAVVLFHATGNFTQFEYV